MEWARRLLVRQVPAQSDPVWMIPWPEQIQRKTPSENSRNSTLGAVTLQAIFEGDERNQAKTGCQGHWPDAMIGGTFGRVAVAGPEKSENIIVAATTQSVTGWG